ncbi:MAG: FtsK/SpoIIIE domain-containing protein, partial [Ilumatobacteraceae bacterium]
LAPLDDPELPAPPTSAIPAVVPLADLLGPASNAAATLTARWRASGAGSSPRAPIGVTQRGAFELDLERDGPHVLIAGSAGSGKSELLRALMVGLAAGQAPDAITFALLGRGGGTAFGGCASLPHVVMHEDVSDPHLMARALRCLRAELSRRDEAMQRGDVPPRLVVAVDEPATNHAEILTELLEIGAGRDGVHLVIATERPSAVLDHAVTSDFGVRIALRLGDAHEATVVLGTAGATTVPRHHPGRGYVRVGLAEPVEMQAARVSGSSAPGTARDLELRPYVVGRELTPMEIRVVRTTTDGHRRHTDAPAGAGDRNDLTRLVTEITAAAGAIDQGRARWACPGPLPDVVSVESLDRPGPGVPFALVDHPDEQRQQVRRWEPGSGGSMLIYGADGSGTSSALAALAIGAAERYAPDDLHLYVVDDGTGTLAPLRALPHTGAVARHDDFATIAALLRLVGAQIDERVTVAGSNLRPNLPQVVVMIDDVGALLRQHADQRRLGEVWSDITRIVRDGPAAGVCAVVTTKRDVPASLADEFAARLVMRLADPAEYASFGFRPTDIPRFVPGRALDPTDRTELQIVEPPASLTAAVAALDSEPARSRPPAAVEGRSS